MASSFQEFAHLRIPLKYIHNATNNFDECNFIAKGAYGRVYKGDFSRSECLTMVAEKRWKGRTIGAVKRWNPSNEDGIPEFRREIMLLSDNKHENLITLLGFCDEMKERILVYEYAPNKSLDFHLAERNFKWVQRLKICLGAARGLQYLHNPKKGKRVLHFDIKSANILLDENWNAKVSDLGFSKYGPATQTRSYLITEAKGTDGYVDPAFRKTMIYKKESDIYSFGVVLFEVLCSRLCIDIRCDDAHQYLIQWVKNSSKEEIRDKIIDSNLRQQMKWDSFDTFLKLALECVEKEPERRPSMDVIVKTLESALKYQEKRRFWKFIKTASGVLLGTAVVAATVLL